MFVGQKIAFPISSWEPQCLTPNQWELQRSWMVGAVLGTQNQSDMRFVTFITNHGVERPSNALILK